MCLKEIHNLVVFLRKPKKHNTITMTTTNIPIRSSTAEYLTFAASVGNTSLANQAQNIEIRYEDENIWLTQKLLATLYNVEVNTINYHLKKIFEDNELMENSVIRNFRITATDGKEYNTKHYNLQNIALCKTEHLKAITICS